MVMNVKPVAFVVEKVREDIRCFPRPARVLMGYALYAAQRGGSAKDVKPLKGFSSRSVLEVIANHDGDTFRAVYTVRLAGVVYVLHAFQKKSKRGIATPKHEIDVIRQRLKMAEEMHRKRKD